MNPDQEFIQRICLCHFSIIKFFCAIAPLIFHTVYIQVEDGERLERALAREKTQENPKYEEMCRRFLADQMDFSEENILKAGIGRRFRNHNLDECVKEIGNYIKSVQ